jgi:hypothetical protein
MSHYESNDTETTCYDGDTGGSERSHLVRGGSWGSFDNISDFGPEELGGSRLTHPRNRNPSRGFCTGLLFYAPLSQTSISEQLRILYGASTLWTASRVVYLGFEMVTTKPDNRTRCSGLRGAIDSEAKSTSAVPSHSS